MRREFGDVIGAAHALGSELHDPFMAMSFLLRGVDIISILSVVAIILLYGVLTLMASIWS